MVSVPDQDVPFHEDAVALAEIETTSKGHAITIGNTIYFQNNGRASWTKVHDGRMISSGSVKGCQLNDKLRTFLDIPEEIHEKQRKLRNV